MRLTIDPDHPKQKVIKQAVEVLKNGGVIVYPTDTVYGLGCDIFQKSALERIFEIKKRKRSQPMSFICSDLAQIGQYAQMENSSFRILKKYLPGPYTFILDARRESPRKILGKRKTVGIRMPAHPVCERLVELLGEPLLTTSANLAGEEAPPDPGAIEEVFGGKVDLILDAGHLSGEPSSVIDLTGASPVVIRAGQGDVDPFLTTDNPAD